MLFEIKHYSKTIMDHLDTSLVAKSSIESIDVDKCHVTLTSGRVLCVPIYEVDKIVNLFELVKLFEAKNHCHECGQVVKNDLIDDINHYNKKGSW